MKNTDRKAEEKYLQDTLQVILKNLANYGSEVSRMQAEIDEMLEHYHDNDVELWTLLNNTITLNEHMKRAMERNERAVRKPYFGRIIFTDEKLGKEESLYIGKGGVSKDHTNWIVVDWRAPVANAYYENGLGRCSYAAPEGREIPIDLKLKRTFEIEESRLLDYFDTEVVANDDLLTKYLSKNKEAVLGEIVATIQKEQNDIIRKSPYHNIIVQGVAGSGKTTVAMHRISYILYNYQERFRPEDFYIVGSNRILLNYITGVLPELDVHGVKQMTMEQLFIRLLYEDWDEKKYRVKPLSGRKDIIKGTEGWYLDLEAFIRRLEWDAIRRESVYLTPRQFSEGIMDGRSGIFDRREEDEKAGKTIQRICLVEQEAVERYITQNPTVSIQSKINMLNERLINKIKDEFLGKGIKYTEGERKAILRAYRGYYGGNQWKKPIYELYEEFLEEQRVKAEAEGRDGSFRDLSFYGAAHSPGGSDRRTAFDVYDLAALALLYKRVKETEVISEAHHVVIDEAQDFGMMAYRVLHACIKDCTYTVMGDVSQNIHFGFGLSDWEALKGLLLPDPMDSFGVLRKSYRNTVEISEFATDILRHGNFPIYPVEPIIRHGNQVTVEELSRDISGKELAGRAAEICREWQRQGLDTIAVVCRNNGEAGEWARLLAEHIQIMESDLEKADFGKGILVLPVEYTKGLEFDAVLIVNPTRAAYPVDDGHARLLYVAATRALHELHILCAGDLTGLIADKLPEISADAAKYVPKAEGQGCRKIPLEKAAAEIGKENSALQETPAGKGRAGAERRPEAVRPKVSVIVKGKTDTKEEIAFNVNTESRVMDCPNKKNSFAGSLPQKGNDILQGNKALQGNNILQGESVLRENSTVFGDMPPTEKLRPDGHSKINLGVRWVTKQEDGLYLQSGYGVLRISPVGSGILRMTFVRDTAFASDRTMQAAIHPLIAFRRTERGWKYRDNGKMVELAAGEVTVQVEKATGAVSYLDKAGHILLRERCQEGRQCGEKGSWLFLELQKKEQLLAVDPDGQQDALKLRGGARYISTGKSLPFLLSDMGYGILPAADTVISCDIPAYGSYLYMEPARQDYYFIAGKQQNLLNAYRLLCGSL